MEQNIEITRGDTASFNLQFVDFAGDLEHDIQDMFLTVKEDINGSAIFQKSLGNGISKVIDNVYVVRIAPEDTEDLNLGYYYYDFEVKINDDVFTLLKGVMQITYDVTDPTSIITIAPYAELQDIRIGYNGDVYPSAGDAVRDQVSDLHEEVDVLDGRMDEFASLPDGSTAGNAELVDIRVGANGITYPSAGDAVRGQVEELDDKILDNATDIGDINSNVDVLKARMDTFASLPDGSTAGDAELEDIRVGADGVTYPSAGDAVREQVSDLKESFNNCFDEVAHTPINLFDTSAIETGCYYWTNGKNTNASYNSSGLMPVSEGDTLHFTRGTQYVLTGRSYFNVRFLIGYDSDGTTVLDSVQNVNGQTGYTVPSGVKYVRISNDTYIEAVGSYTMVQTVSGLIDFVSYFAPYDSYYLKKGCLLDSAIPKHFINGMEYSFDIASDDHVFNDSDEQVQDMFGYSIQFNGRVSALTELIIAHGYNSYMGGYVKITPTQFSYYLGTEASPRVSEAHDLTIKDYISIRIDAKPNYTADFTIYTNGGVYTKQNQAWDVRKGALGVKSGSGTNTLTGCNLSYMCKGWSEKIHLYGDSYFGVYSDKWTQYLTNNNWLKNNLNAYPGRASAEALRVLKNVLANSNPDKIVWCLGMNDGDDDGAVDAVWKASVDELMTICEERNIELILATIPNVPTVDNTYKNAYVRASGYRYIDFAFAVGASSGTTWYDGMLSNDGVHPSVTGAIALFNQAIADVPELMQ